MSVLNTSAFTLGMLTCHVVSLRVSKLWCITGDVFLPQHPGNVQQRTECEKAQKKEAISISVKASVSCTFR